MLFDFNTYSGLLLPAVLQGILFTILLLWRGYRLERLSDKLLAAIIVLYTLRVASWMLGFAGWYDSHDAYTTFMFYFPFNYWLALGPLIYLLFRALTNQSFRLGKRHFWHFLPVLLSLSIDLGLFLYEIVYQHWILEMPLVGHYGTRGRLVDEGIPVIKEIFFVLTYVSILAYTIYTVRQYRQYKIYLSNHFADTSDINFNWLRNLLYAMILGIAIWFIFNFIELVSNVEFSYIESWYSYLSWGIIIYYISIQGYVMQSSEQLIPLDFDPELSPSLTTKTPFSTERNKLKTDLDQLMKEERPYLDQDLSLSKLAVLSDTSHTMISKVINEEFGQNFNEFVNQYRVEEMKKKLLDKSFEHYSILGIAFECGFKSKATFNRAFRKHTGLSPTQYIKSK